MCLGGGTVRAAAAEHRLMLPIDDPDQAHSAFEDGTLNFHGILALRHGFSALCRMGGMSSIENYVADIRNYTENKLENLLHENGARVCNLYKRKSSRKGSIISFNIFRSDGSPIGFDAVGKKAAKAVIII